MNSKISQVIKITSTIFISGAIGLECWNIYLNLHNAYLPANLNRILWIGNVALVAHGVEGLIAAFKAGSQNKNPIAYGIYTFFVGFPGLKELDSKS